MPKTDIEDSISSQEIHQAFDAIDEILSRTPRWNDLPESVQDIREFCNAMGEFDRRYSKTLQKYYELVARIEKCCDRSGMYALLERDGYHSFEAYDAAHRLLKQVPLVKQRWRKWKR